MTEFNEQPRIERMLSEGKLTAAEAERLLSSLDAQRERSEALQRAAQPAARERRRLWLLLGLLLSCFVLGVGSQWLLHDDNTGDSVSVAAAEPPPAAPAEGRLIDLSGLAQERSKIMTRALPLSIGILSIGTVTVLCVLLVFVYNGLVSLREQVNAGWAQVENVYQRRLDLVPLLIDSVQTYTEHERETLTELTEARAHAIQVGGAVGAGAPETVEQLKAVETSQGAVESALARLFAIVENYPDLKASRNFLSLQDQIEGTENRVTMERRSYNEFSRRYNTRLQTFPSNIIAELMGFDAKPYFEAETVALQGLKDPFGRHTD